METPLDWTPRQLLVIALAVAVGAWWVATGEVVLGGVLLGVIVVGVLIQIVLYYLGVDE